MSARAAAAVAGLLLLVPVPSPAAQGVRGRTAQGGTLVEGAEVSVYARRAGSFGRVTGDAPVARARTDAEGVYAVEVPAGRYVVEALKKKAGNRAPGPEEGDLYCLYSGSPVTVAAGRWTGVGLNVAPVPAEARKKGAASRVSGSLTFKGAPVEHAYLYAYKTVEGDFRGPADLLQPVAKGTFSVRLPPGAWYLVARKRARGGAYGPVETGDLFNFYPRNPVTLADKEEVTLEIPLVERLSQLETDETSFQGTVVTVLDRQGKPLAGRFVLVYPNAARSGPPAATSAPTDAAGQTRLAVPPGARYLRARASLGGPLAEGESFADGEVPDAGAAAITLRPGQP